MDAFKVAEIKALEILQIIYKLEAGDTLYVEPNVCIVRIVVHTATDLLPDF